MSNLPLKDQENLSNEPRPASNICEAKRYDKEVPDKDSLTVDFEENVSVIETALSGDRTGYYVPDMRTLYFFNGEIKIRIKANLPMEELIKIAESMG